MVEGERGFTRPVLIPEVIEVHPAPSAIAPAKARVLFSVATTTPSLSVYSPAAIEPNTQLVVSALTIGRTSIASGLPTICVPFSSNLSNPSSMHLVAASRFPSSSPRIPLMAFVAAIASWREAATQQGAARGTHVAVREVWPQRLLDCLVFVCAVGGVVVEGKGVRVSWLQSIMTLQYLTLHISH